METHLQWRSYSVRINWEDEKFIALGQTFKPVAAVWHAGNTPNVGHYKAFVERAGKWWECNDTLVQESTFPEKMEGIVLIVLERIEME